MENNQNGNIQAAILSVAKALQDQNILSQSNPYMFKAWTTVGGTLAASVDTKIVFDSLQYNRGSCFDLANDWFLVPVDGVYHFDLAVHIGASVSSHNLQLRVNNVLQWIGQELTNLSGTAGLSGSVDLPLLKGDKVEMYAWNGSGAAKSYQGTIFRTQLSGRLVST